MGKYFGTDGIRGIANDELDVILAYKAGFAAAAVLTHELAHKANIMIGKDTRISGDMLEAALCAGICAAGANAVILGVIPTPAVAYLTIKHKADAGIVISASHNPFEHNGIKIFGQNGCKLSDELELEVEQCIDNQAAEKAETHENIGRVIHFEEKACEEYAEHIIRDRKSIAGVRAVFDCANGAAHKTAHLIFEKLGVDAQFIADAPNGININANCGSTHLQNLCAAVKDGGYDIGVAFDGDADRCLLVDELGEVIDGDKIMGIIARELKETGKLRGALVATIMSNLGLHSYLGENGIDILTTSVGDRYVLERMLADGCNLGGEQSGHVILTDHATTGDGELTAVTFLEILKKSGKCASELAGQIERYPQVMINVKVPNAQKKSVATLPQVREVGAEITKIFGTKGRIVIRPSGTEALVRVMVEGQDIEKVTQMAEKAADVIRAAFDK